MNQVFEEPCEGKLSCTVLKERVGKRFPTRLYQELNVLGMTRKAKKGSKRKVQKTGLNRSMLDVGIGVRFVGQKLKTHKRFGGLAARYRTLTTE